MPTRRAVLRTVPGLVLSLATPLASTLSGCKKGEAPSTEEVPHHVIASKVRALSMTNAQTLRVFYPKGCLPNLSAVVSEFRRLTKVKLELIEASLDKISSEIILENQISQGTPRFDVAIPATFGIPDLVEANAILRLDELAGQYQLSSLAANSIYSLGDRYKGQLYGYQTDGDAYTMFYNRSWLDAERHRKSYADSTGTPLRVPKTWDELDKQMAFFHKPDEGRFGGSLFRTMGYIAWEFWVRLHSEGVFPVDDEMKPRLDSPAGLRALEKLIAASASLEPGAVTNGLFENFESFSDGTKFANIGWGGTQKHLRSEASALKGRIANGLLPGGIIDGKPTALPYFNWGWNYVVAANSPHKELAYLFILFASTPHVSTLSVRESGYFDPFRKEHYSDPTIESMYGREFLDIHQESLTHCIPDFYVRGQGRYLAALKHAVHGASLGQIDPKKALEAAQSKWETLTDTFGRAEQIEQWRFLKRSYPERLRTRLV